MAAQILREEAQRTFHEQAITKTLWRTSYLVSSILVPTPHWVLQQYVSSPIGLDSALFHKQTDASIFICLPPQLYTPQTSLGSNFTNWRKY